MVGLNYKLLYKRNGFSHFSERSSSFSLGREIHHLLVRSSTTVRVVFGEEEGSFSSSPPPFLLLCFWFLFSCCCRFFGTSSSSRRSILLRHLCCYPGLFASFPFWPLIARRSSSSMKQPRSSLVLRWVLLNLRSTYLRLTWAYTHHSAVTTGLSALHRHLKLCLLHFTCRNVSSTRLSMDLMRQRVYPTLRAVASSCILLPWTVHPFGRSSTFIADTTGFLFFCCIAVYICYVFLCIFLLYFVVFILLPFCLGCGLHLVLGLIFVVEISVPIWFFAMPALQLLLYSDGCFTRIGLFTEFLCFLHRLVRPWNRLGLLIVLLELLVITIACCLVFLDWIQILFLYLHCILSFGLCCWGALPLCFRFIVGEPTPLSFLGCPTSSSFWIKSGKDPSL
jgi:hypothetical protein